MGKQKLVSVRATGPGIVMVNGRAGQVAKGMTCDVDPMTAAQYDFLEVIQPPAAEPEVSPAPEPKEEKKTTPKGRSKSSTARKRASTKKKAGEDTPASSPDSETPIP